MKNKYFLHISLLLCVIAGTIFADEENLIPNGGFEEKNGETPSQWSQVNPSNPVKLQKENAFQGNWCARIDGNEKPGAFKAEINQIPTTLFKVSGWFNASDIVLSIEAKDYLRFYCHIHYKNKPYSETTHNYIDIPVNTAGWHKASILLVPTKNYEVSHIWIQVLGQMRSGTLLFDEISMSAMEDIETAPKLMGNVVDFLDMAVFIKGDYEKDFLSIREMDDRIRLAARSGVKKMYYRCLSGKAYHPSTVLEAFIGDPARPELLKPLLTTMEKYDVLAEFIKSAKKHKMEVYYWEPIFDTQVYLRSPSEELAKKYGEFPYEDRYFATNNALYWKHRYAGKYAQYSLKMPIGKIELRTFWKRDIRVKKENVSLYVAEENADFQKYEKDFSFTVSNYDSYNVLIFDDLKITNKCIKFVHNLNDGKFTTAFNPLEDPDIFKIYYTDKSRVDVFSVLEAILADDINIEGNRRGGMVKTFAWDYGKRTMILRIGMFDPYAGGIPDYSQKASRDRRLAVAKELFTKYPGIDGLTYSLRSHSLPSGGSQAMTGGPQYGFNENIVAEYKKKYGTDIINEKYDVKKFSEIHGQFFTDFLREVSALTRSYKKKFEVMVPVSENIPYSYGSMYGVFDGFHHQSLFDCGTWARENIVDNILMLGTPTGWKQWSSQWDSEILGFYDILQKNSKRKRPDLSVVYHIVGTKQDWFRSIIKNMFSNPLLDQILFYEEEVLYRDNLYDVIIEEYEKHLKSVSE